MARYILLHETASTNTYLKRMAALLPSGTVVYTHRQTAGRGQKGNSWEAEPGKNLTFSMLLKQPGVAAARQFCLSEAVSLAIVDAIDARCSGDVVTVKWPNDIYWHDRKLCGILLELSLMGSVIDYMVAGVGLNVNQERFVSDAPNPVSLKQITGSDTGLDALLRDVCSRIELLCAQCAQGPEAVAALHRRYLSRLYRNDGKPHPFAKPSGERFEATISGVMPDGMLVLRHTDTGHEHTYAFKEVSHVIDSCVL